jgi:hypothetical protein
MKHRVVVAIDSPAGAGKSTVVAPGERLNYVCRTPERCAGRGAVGERGENWDDLLMMEQLTIAADIGLESNPLRVR